MRNLEKDDKKWLKINEDGDLTEVTTGVVGDGKVQVDGVTDGQKIYLP